MYLRLGEQLRRAPVRRLVLRHLAPHLLAQIGRLDDDGGGRWRRTLKMQARKPPIYPPIGRLELSTAAADVLLFLQRLVN